MTWLERAACRDDPELWFTAGERNAAVHICRAHCPVIRDCLAALHELEALGVHIHGGVMAGTAFGSDGVQMGDVGCREVRRGVRGVVQGLPANYGERGGGLIVLCPHWNPCHTRNPRVYSNSRLTTWDDKNGREKRLRRFARPKAPFHHPERSPGHMMPQARHAVLRGNYSVFTATLSGGVR